MNLLIASSNIRQALYYSRTVTVGSQRRTIAGLALRWMIVGLAPLRELISLRVYTI